jgi:DNA-binding transcriptional MerR regulator
MRIGELSRTTEVTVPTIKFYVREGLLPPGHPTASPNQVDYDEAHLRRLILLRALIQVGGLSLATARSAVTVLDAKSGSPYDVLHALYGSNGTSPGGETRDDELEAQASVSRLFQDRNWQNETGSGLGTDLVAAVTALRRLGRPVSDEALVLYADAADKFAKKELITRGPGLDDEAAAEAALIDAVLFGSVLASMRQLAHLRQASLPPRAERTADSPPKKKRSKRKEKKAS